MIRDKFCLFILLLAISFFASCSTKKQTVTDVGSFATGDYDKSVVVHDNDFQKFVFEIDYAFERNNFQYIFSYSETFLQSQKSNELQKIYIKNLLMYLLTYHDIDLEKAYSIGITTLNDIEKRISIYGVEKLEYSNVYKKKVSATGSGKLLAGTGVLLGAIVYPFTMFESRKFREDFNKGYKDMKEKAFGASIVKFSLDTKLVEQFFLVDTCSVHKHIVQLKSYINEMVGEGYANQQLNERHYALCIQT